jgi:very-short-patch-repair endonuclease
MDRRSARRYRDTERLAELLRRQHGVATTTQAAECGYSKWAVSRAVAAMEFRWVYRGVLAIAGPPLKFSGHCMAAVLACGTDAALSHHAAAALHDLRPVPQGAIDVTAPGDHRHSGIRCHISPIPQQHRTHIEAIPVTALERTFIDYAEQATPRQLTAALEAAERLSVLDLRKLQNTMDSAPGRRGLKPLRAAIADMSADLQWTQSDLEDRFLRLIVAAGLPVPKANRLEDGKTVDFVWRRERLIVEVDSFGFHKSRRSFEDDRRRDTQLQKRGWRVVRITDLRLANEPDQVIADIRDLLGNQ